LSQKVPKKPKPFSHKKAPARPDSDAMNAGFAWLTNSTFIMAGEEGFEQNLGIF
jgi:hypothetical protein